jgi:hypothetical protein
MFPVGYELFFISQKTAFFIVIPVITSKLKKKSLYGDVCFSDETFNPDNYILLQTYQIRIHRCFHISWYSFSVSRAVGGTAQETIDIRKLIQLRILEETTFKLHSAEETFNQRK